MYRCVHENRRWMLATRAHQSVPYQSRENDHLPPLISFDNYNRSERGHRVKDSRFEFWGFYLSLLPQYQTPDVHWSKAIYLINIKPMCTSPLCQLIFVVNLTLTSIHAKRGRYLRYISAIFFQFSAKEREINTAPKPSPEVAPSKMEVAPF